MSISVQDHQLLLALQGDPLAPDLHLAKKLNVSPPTIKNRLNKLFEKGILNHTNYVSSTPNPESLGMEHHSVLVSVPFGHQPTLFNFADYHPYTAYIIACFGGINGFFMQFMIPKGTSHLLIKGFQTLDEMGIISDFIHFGGRVTSQRLLADVERWDPIENNWDFDFDQFYNIFQHASTDKIVSPPSISSIHSQASMLDFIILRELTKNARRKQSQILQAIQDAVDNQDDENHLYYVPYIQPSSNSDPSDPRIILDKYLLSERMQFLKENNVVKENALLFTRSKFKLFNRLLFQGQTEPSLSRKLYYSLESRNFPFSTGFELLEQEGQILWWMNIPPQWVSKFTQFTQEICGDQLHIMFLDNERDYKYYFYHENYDVEEADWKKSYDWIVEKPLAALGL